MKSYKGRFLAGLLAGAMVLSLAGCNKKEEATTQARKDFYYVPEYQKLDLGVEYISNAVTADEALILMGYSWDEDTGESRDKLYRMDFASGQATELALEMDGNSSVQYMDVGPDGNLLMAVSRYVQIGQQEDGSESKESGEEAGESKDGADGAQTGEEAESGEDSANDETASSGEEVSQDEPQEVVASSASGTVVISAGTSSASTSSFGAGTVVSSGEPESEPQFESYLELWKVSPQDGTVISVTDLKPAFEDPDNVYIQQMAVDNEGNLYISGGDNNIYLLDPDGNKIGTIAVENWVDSLFATKEGQVYMKTWGNEGEEIHPVDIKEKKLGDTVTSENLMADTRSYNANYHKGLEKGVLVNTDSMVYTYDFAQDKREDLFEWLDADINSDDVREMGQMPDGRIWALLRDYSMDEPEHSLVYLTKTPADQVVEKEEILYATMWLDQRVRRNIIKFNKASDKYRVRVKEYASDDYSTGLTQFNNDITSGNGPDIIDISNIDFKQYASKGVMENLYPYMERDGIDKADYLENVLKAFEVDGKLYGIIPQFYVTTTVAKASKVGEASGWTLGEMLDFVQSSNPENIFQYGSRMSIFYYCIYNNIDEFIDWENSTCKFDSEDFIRVLEFANKFPEEPDYSEEDEGTSAKLRSDKLLLMQTSLSSVQEYQMMNGLFGEKVSYIGYPNSERKGNLIQASNGCVAINAKSKHKDGAWEFVKTMISGEYQDSLVDKHGSWGFPVKKSALEKQFEADMTPEYYEDENGNQVEQMKTSWGYDDFNIDIYAAKPEEIEAVRQIIASAERTAGSVNEELVNIITEETAPFFKGQKSAKDTAEIIQNRISIYVKENS